MASKRHPHTNAVKLASARMQDVIDSFSGDPRFMQKVSSETERRHARIDEAAPDVKAWKGRLTLEQIEKLAKMDID